MTLGHLLTVDQILPEMKSTERWSAIVELVELLVGVGQVKSEDRDVVLEYYSLEKIAKIKLRKQMAARLGCRIQTLHTRMFFIRNDLKDCIFRCMEKKHVRNR